ncbi:lysophospholipid acyltransferase family protein [Streptomyces diastatochromogenes]|nr:lysophospholipid acyltransferase family protein [Streptomyces diastatochromogenes]
MVRAFGVRVRYEGTAGAVTGPLLVVANHVSWLDIPLVAAVLPGRMVAKTEVRHWPVLGTLAAFGGTLFLDRDRLRALPGAVREMAGCSPAGAGWSSSRGVDLVRTGPGRFRPAAFQAALDAGCAVLPVRIDYRPTDAAAYVGDDPLGASLWRVVTARDMVAHIRILDPIPSVRYPDRRALASAAQLAVASDSANLPSPSVHQRVSSRSAAASSSRTPA